MLSTNYVRQRVRNAKRDSVLREETEGKIQDLDSLYASFDAKEQKRMLEEAVGFCSCCETISLERFELSFFPGRDDSETSDRMA